MIVDCHCHVFSKQIIENVLSRPLLVRELKLSPEAARRDTPESLVDSAAGSGVDLCLLLPTAQPERVRDENDRHLALAENHPGLRALMTLHPAMSGAAGEISRILDLGIRGFKMSSFSQRFDPLSREAGALLSLVEETGSERGVTPAVFLDTFTRADVHFGAPPHSVTRPAALAALARRYRRVNFVGAHMGGLAAPFDELRRELSPEPNLFLDTSNAAHTLGDREFVELVQMHGPGRILFGTDWPWFDHASEIRAIDVLLDRAGCGPAEKEDVFGRNVRKLLGL